MTRADGKTNSNLTAPAAEYNSRSDAAATSNAQVAYKSLGGIEEKKEVAGDSDDITKNDALNSGGFNS